MTTHLARILIAEDDDGIRASVERLLRLEGYEVVGCANGSLAMAAALSFAPQVLVTDVHMPIMDGFDLLKAVRGEPTLDDCAVIMLTAAEDRANMRRGMTSGADDYITKPFRREELLESISVQLKKRELVRAQHERDVAQARSEAQVRLRREFVAELAAATNHAGMLESMAVGEVSARNATVLFSDIRNFTTAAEKLQVTEVAHILGAYFERACNCVQRHGGHHLKLMGDGLMAVFDDASPASSAALTPPASPARRAILAGIDLAVGADEFQQWLTTRYSDRGLPAFAIGVGIHSGEVLFGRLGSSTASEVTPLGDAVNTAARLEGLSKQLGWTLVVSQVCTDLAGLGFDIGRRETMPLKGRSANVSVCEVKGVNNREPVEQRLDAPNAAAEERIRQAIRRNSEVTSLAVKDALNFSMTQLNKQSEEAVIGKRFETYRNPRKIGQGGSKS
jgi:serine/threonine-protein kinase PpkA